MKTYKFYILFFLLLLLCNCRTMQLNQDGRVLGKGVKETTVGGGISPVGYFVGPVTIAPNLNIEIQQRFGINDKVEMQLKGHSDLTMLMPPYISNANELNCCVKINVFNEENYACSVMPFSGFIFGYSPMIPKGYLIPPNASFYLNPTYGVAVIASKDNEKHTFYWGGTFMFSPEFSLAGVAIGNFYFPFEMDITFNLGWEIEKNTIFYRHEIDFFTQLDYTNNFPKVGFGAGYHFSVGFRYAKDEY